MFLISDIVTSECPTGNQISTPTQRAIGMFLLQDLLLLLCLRYVIAPVNFFK